ncbi:8395_t:CDS:2, partial [Entrophospora sp. SA101]
GIPSQSSSYFAMTVVCLLLDPKYGTDMKDKHFVMKMQKLDISKSSESSDSNDASDAEKYSNQSENEIIILHTHIKCIISVNVKYC